MSMEHIGVSVSELNKYIKDKFDNDEGLNNVVVKGEISNFKKHFSGHMYFTLKDENSLIKCIMFKTSNMSLTFDPKDGQKVIIFGTVSVFERDGAYQLYAKSMKEDGVGTLHKLFEELKKELKEKGYFEESRKQKIPFMPKCIAVVTSKTGSVIRDIINVSTRRNPNVYLRVFPVGVQGDGAAKDISKAIELINNKKLADVIIIARGGGSLEDLWPFNEKQVAEAIYNSKIPLISAVGHETDFTIADFVSDLRAPTPSAAAELAVVDIKQVELNLERYNYRFKMALKKNVELKRLKFEKYMNLPVFKDPYKLINEKSIKLDNLVKVINDYTLEKFNEKKNYAINNYIRLDGLSPLKTLTRGYSLVQLNDNIIKSKNNLKKDDKINIVLSDGTVSAKII